jgi:pimeloyl-ACP methyl ester carboxylesterase
LADGVALTSHTVPSFMHEGRRLAYSEYGNGGRTVVLLHGLLLNRRMHDPLARAPAGSGNRVVTLDLLGHGDSGRPPACGGTR